VYGNEDLKGMGKTVVMFPGQGSQLADMVEQGLTYDAAIGLSLGEYSALTASGALSYEDGVRLVINRGIYMEQEVPAGIGAMAAVIGLTSDEVDSVLAKYNKDKSGNTESDYSSASLL
jgi:malonyl CoA-acyl carrier protein transacylase